MQLLDSAKIDRGADTNACYHACYEVQVYKKNHQFCVLFLLRCIHFSYNCHKVIFHRQMFWMFKITTFGGSIGSNYLTVNVHASKSPFSNLYLKISTPGHGRLRQSWTRTRFSSGTVSIVMQCLRPPRHSGGISPLFNIASYICFL